jgi:uncharacterized small protein (DUF1192 family)
LYRKEEPAPESTRKIPVMLRKSANRQSITQQSEINPFSSTTMNRASMSSSITIYDDEESQDTRLVNPPAFEYGKVVSMDELRQKKIALLTKEIEHLEQAEAQNSPVIEPSSTVIEETKSVVQEPPDPSIQREYISYLQRFGVNTDIMPATRDVITNDRMDRR